MAVYFAPPPAGGSAGIGASIGESLSKTLQMLAQSKMLQQQQQQMMRMQEQAQQRKAFDVSRGLAAMGVPDEISQQISFMPESQQNLFLKQFFGSEAFGAGESGMTGELEEGLQTIDAAKGLEDLLGPRRPVVAEEVEAEGIVEPTAVGEAPEPDYGALTKQIQAKVDALSPEDRKALKGEIERIKTEVAPKAEEAIPAEASREAKPGYRLQAKPAAKKSFKELLATPRPTAADRKRAEDLAMKKETMSLARQKEINKDTKSYFDETMKSGKAARENDMRLKRMSALLKKGKLTSPAFYNILNTIDKGLFGFGVNLKFLMNPDSQEFEKLSTDFTKNAKDIFGSRVTQSEIQLFLKTIPTLSQTDAGKRRVIRNWKMLNEAGKLKKKAMLEIIEMNGGQRPAGLQVLVEKKVGPKLDQLARQFAGKKKEKKAKDEGVLGTILGGIESARRYLSPSKR